MRNFMRIDDIRMGMARCVGSVLACLLFAMTATGQQGDRPRLKAGDVAPDFTLKSLDGQSQTTLSDHRDDRPVVLFFGSYT